jgi:hypothetical protein
VVVAVSYDHPRGKLGDLWEHAEFMDVGWSHRKTSYDSRPADPHVHPEAVEGLLEEGVLAESGLSLKTRAAVGAGEQACRQGKRVRQGEGGVVGSEEEKLLPEALLYLPEIGCLPREGGSMYLAKSGEPFCLVPPEEEVDGPVGVYAEELAYNLDGEHFGVRELRRRAALADAVALDSVIHEAEDADDEGAKIHEGRPPLRWLVWSLPSVGRSSLSFKPSRKLAHRVS